MSVERKCNDPMFAGIRRPPLCVSGRVRGDGPETQDGRAPGADPGRRGAARAGSDGPGHCQADLLVKQRKLAAILKLVKSRGAAHVLCNNKLVSVSSSMFHRDL